MLAGLSGVPGGLINAGMAAGIPTQYAQSPDGSFD